MAEKGRAEKLFDALIAEVGETGILRMLIASKSLPTEPGCFGLARLVALLGAAVADNERLWVVEEIKTEPDKKKAEEMARVGKITDPEQKERIKKIAEKLRVCPKCEHSFSIKRRTGKKSTAVFAATFSDGYHRFTEQMFAFRTDS